MLTWNTKLFLFARIQAAAVNKYNVKIKPMSRSLEKQFVEVKPTI